MKIVCPKCGFAGGFAATVPSDTQRADGEKSRPVDLLDNPSFLEPEPNALAMCSDCGTVLIYVGWTEVPPDAIKRMSPSDQKMIRNGQEAIRRLKQQQGGSA
jgi:hypothetical protein